MKTITKFVEWEAGSGGERDFQKHTFRAGSGHSVHNKISQPNPLQCYTKFVYSLATPEKPCVSTSQTILVFGEIPVIQNHDSKSLPLLLTMVFNCFVFFSRGNGPLMSQLDIVTVENGISLTVFIWRYSLTQSPFITNHQAKDIGSLLNPQDWQFQESLSILLHFIHSTKFTDHFRMKQYPW